MTSLLNKSISRLAVCITIILVLCAPLFYFLTERFYAEDLSEVLESFGAGNLKEHLDFQQDIVEGMMLQYALIAAVLVIAITITIHFVTRRLWQPFDHTLQTIETFRLERDKNPFFPQTDIKEFQRLNQSIRDLIDRDIRSYKIQKEFTQNASHELQTPIAIIRSNLDLLLQEQLNERQTKIIQNIYDVTTRLGHLNRNLLLLAKIDNNQFDDKQPIDLNKFIENILPQYANLYTQTLSFHSFQPPKTTITANLTLLEILLNNLFINALRHNNGGDILIRWDGQVLSVSNEGSNEPLNSDTLFSRFNNPLHHPDGNGLGLAIAKQICDFHHWTLSYFFENNRHTFRVFFFQKK